MQAATLQPGFCQDEPGGGPPPPPSIRNGGTGKVQTVQTATLQPSMDSKLQLEWGWVRGCATRIREYEYQ